MKNKETLVFKPVATNRDRFGSLLSKIKVDINISSVELWLIRILLWGFYIKLILSVLK